MIEIRPGIGIDENELQFTFIRAAGPGGQNVNKVSTSVQLRFDVLHSSSIPDEIKPRLIQLGGSRMTEDGILIIEARRYRTQDQNRTDAVQRLITLIQKAAKQEAPRFSTHPTRASQIKRVDSKKKRGVIKRNRKSSPIDWE
jgi:ribosome-associated protein